MFQKLLFMITYYETTSIYLLIQYLEWKWGVFYSEGGTGKIIDGLEKLLENNQVEIKKNTEAQKAAGVIHSDFEKNFIRAEVVSYDDFEKYGSFEKAKENGKLKVEGKNYFVKDGDVLFFRVNP